MHVINMKMILSIVVRNTSSIISMVIQNYHQCESDKRSTIISLVHMKNNDVLVSQCRCGRSHLVVHTKSRFNLVALQRKIK
jgi:hypothetical protein